jgi:hypothetical protein
LRTLKVFGEVIKASAIGTMSSANSAQKSQ